jgi:quercetin dioxygenase-like cupin family protein
MSAFDAPGEVLGRLSQPSRDEPFPGVLRRTFQTEQSTLASYVMQPGASFPLHRHAQEQITVICDGDAEFMVDGASHRLAAGQTFVVAPEVEHGLRAGASGARLLAIVVPRRDLADGYTLSARRGAPTEETST